MNGYVTAGGKPRTDADRRVARRRRYARRRLATGAGLATGAATCLIFGGLLVALAVVLPGRALPAGSLAAGLLLAGCALAFYSVGARQFSRSYEESRQLARQSPDQFGADNVEADRLLRGSAPARTPTSELLVAGARPTAEDPRQLVRPIGNPIDAGNAHGSGDSSDLASEQSSRE